MNLFGNKQVNVGTPEEDKHLHQPNGDSVIAVEHVRREYEEGKRRQRPREIAEKIVEWILISVAVVGFGALIFGSVADLSNTYGSAVPISIIVLVAITLLVNWMRR